MLTPGRLPVSDAEQKAIEKLMAENEGEPVSFTRRDPGETGPVLAHVGDKTIEIDEGGHRKKVT